MCLLVCVSSGVALSAWDNLEDRMYHLEMKIDLLSEKMDWILGYLERGPAQDVKSDLWIEHIDDLYCTIKLSNGWKLNYSSFAEQSIAHWLDGQPVRLEAGKKKGGIRLVNLATGEGLETEKSLW